MNRSQKRKLIHSLKAGPTANPALTRGAFAAETKTSAAAWERKFFKRGLIAGTIAGALAAAASASPAVFAIVAAHVVITALGGCATWRLLGRMRRVDE